MIFSKKLLLFNLFSLLCPHITMPMTVNASNDVAERQTYIVYMGELPKNTISVMDQHHSLLSNAIGDETIARNSKIHSYGRSFNGFAARLLPHEAQLLSQKEGVVSVFPNKVLKLLTTRSWDFLGMPMNNDGKHIRQTESDTIVALFDTGILVDSPSFSDKGFGPPPKKWKGKCDKGNNFTSCNNKVIGARFFNLGGIVYDDETTPADTEGHGTHTASTAAGVPVEGASLYGIAPGTARGGLPSARVASYKVCWGNGCQDVDLLAAFDSAIADGVDLISVSIGGDVRNFTTDSIAIGSFHAATKGILTVCAAGNDGPSLRSIENVAPWILTVAASTTDRKLVTDVTLGNGQKINGIALNTFSPNKKLYPLTNGILARNPNASEWLNPGACDGGSLSVDKIKGKIVYCIGGGGDSQVPFIGGAGTIMSDDYYLSSSSPTQGLATYVSNDDGLKINEYINSTSSPSAVIFKTTSVNVTDPIVASFSSRGPQDQTPNILKPDITAPGVDILAAYTTLKTMTGTEEDKRVVKYNVVSGTSMATPHVAGAAAYVKAHHPMWSPAAIKSALMTTATPFKIKPDEAELASGSGQINPVGALHPGLVYDIDTIAYIGLLCRQGYTNKDIILLTGSKKYDCSNVPRAKGADGLNYPSIYYQVKALRSNISQVYYRTVTNVGYGKSVYKVEVDSPSGISIEVNPKVLTFDRAYEKKSFTVTLKGRYPEVAVYLSGSIVWSGSKHSVRSPVLVSFYNSSVFY